MSFMFVLRAEESARWHAATDEDQTLPQIAECLGDLDKQLNVRICHQTVTMVSRDVSSFATMLRSRARPSRIASTSASSS